MNVSFQKLFFMLAVVFGLFAVLVFAKVVLIPLSLALFISFILLPVSKKLEGWGLNKLLSAFLSLLLLVVIIGGGVTLFSTQIVNLSDQLYDFSGKILRTFSDIIVFVNRNVNFIGDLNRDELVHNGKAWLKESSGLLLQNTFSGTASVLTAITIIIIFTFLFLIYREGLTRAFVAMGDDENKSRIFGMLKNVQRVGKKYLSGMFLLILVLGFINSIGLWIIGIDSPFLFGFLASLLSIIPFIGTIMGAIIPVLYAFMTTDSLWMPVAIIILFWFIQVIEGNILYPKIVGSSLDVNAIVAILSLLIGAAVWGIAGMILFLPFAAMFKVICEEFDELKPVAMLISNDISGDKKEETKTYRWIEKIKGWFKKK